MSKHVNNSQNTRYKIFAQIKDIDQGIANAESKLAQTNFDKTQDQQNLAAENSTIEQYRNLLALTIANENPLNKLYCGIKEFKVQGMCGMDMADNMGEYVDCDMVLTGQELLDISSLLCSNADGRYKPSDLAEQLKEKGYEVTANDNAVGGNNSEAALTIKTSHGEIKLKDGNGDGMLNGMDYDFSCALAKLSEDMDAYEAKINEINNKIDLHVAKAEDIEDDIKEEDAIISKTEEEKEELEEERETVLDEKETIDKDKDKDPSTVEDSLL